MLGTNAESTFAELLERHPQLFHLPEELTEELVEKGELPRWTGSKRVAPRFRCCSPVIVECQYAPAVLGVWQPTARCILRDISQSGMSILGGHQFYPDQILKIYLPVATATVRVARCRYIDEDCYETGVRTTEYLANE